MPFSALVNTSMAKLGFLYSVELKRYGSQRVRLIYRPFAAWICAAIVSLILGIVFISAFANSTEFQLFTGIFCIGLLVLGLNLLHHLGSVVEIDFDKITGQILYKKTLIRTHFEQPLKLARLVRVEAIAPRRSINPKLCLIFTTVNPIYLDLFLCRAPRRLAKELNQFLRLSETPRKLAVSTESEDQ